MREKEVKSERKKTRKKQREREREKGERVKAVKGSYSRQ